AIVLMLTAGEHLLRFGRRAVWRPLLLLGIAALIKETTILALPVVTMAFLPKRERWPYVATAAAAVTPFALYASHPLANVRRAGPRLFGPRISRREAAAQDRRRARHRPHRRSQCPSSRPDVVDGFRTSGRAKLLRAHRRPDLLSHSGDTHPSEPHCAWRADR